MDKHTLLQWFCYITSLASLAYTFTTLHTLQYAMTDHDNNTQLPQPDHDLMDPSASSSAAHDTPTTSTSEKLEKTSGQWTKNKIKLLEVTVSAVLLSLPHISSFVIMYWCSICIDYFITSSICCLFVLVDIFIEFISSCIDRTEA